MMPVSLFSILPLSILRSCHTHVTFQPFFIKIFKKHNASGAELCYTASRKKNNRNIHYMLILQPLPIPKERSAVHEVRPHGIRIVDRIIIWIKC